VRRFLRGSAVGLALVLAASCATGRAIRSAESAAQRGDWDTAVAYYRQALGRDPSRVDIKIALERATQAAATEHIKRARDLEAQDQLTGAVAEYRLAADLDPSNTVAVTKATSLEQEIRRRIEAAQAQTPMGQARLEAAQTSPIPRLDPRLKVENLQFSSTASVKDILNFIGSTTGINITYDQQIPQLNNPYGLTLSNTSLQDALSQVLTANQLTYKVINPTTIFVYADTTANRQKFEDVYVQTFYLSNADPQELVTLLTQVTTSQGLAVRPVITPNKTANAIVVKATAPVMDVISQLIEQNDKPPAEVTVDVEILEVDRIRAKQLGLDLSTYALGFTFSPELAPPNSSATFPPAAAPPFNLNTLSQGVSAQDFYMSAPTALVRLLESDQKTRVLARPQLRGTEGKALTLNLGDSIPIATTTFNAAAAGGVANIPATQISYRNVGVNLSMTPHVNYKDEIVLENLTVDKSGLGPDINIAGQNIPTFVDRQAVVNVRLRDGESTLLAGLVRSDDTDTLTSLPGLLHVPILRYLFGNRDRNLQETDIVMVVTPHIVRTHDITARDLKPMYVGTSTNFGGGAAPPLIAPGTPPPAPPVPMTGQVTGAGQAGGGTTPPVQGQAGAAAPPAGAAGAPPPPATPPAPVVSTPPAAAPPARAVNVVPVEPVGGAAEAPSLATQIIVQPPGTELQTTGGPYTTAVEITGVSQLSTVSVTVTYNPAVLKALSVSQGTFMQQGGVKTTFVPKIDEKAGRVDIVITRTGDDSGASGTGLLAAIVFQAVAPGASPMGVSAVAMTPKGAPISVQLVPSSVTVK
jgi:general secretion pathway protein D